ncbi:hypothetical protein UK99_21980 [Frankia casuarinae]|uniref:hypothetical protein n=1 Tax=Frankia TaxID=1854 RepID=UPI0004DD8A41|nr:MULTISPECIES: hypothetical protein [Frankia]KEZ34668.1 hypothetical protein CEDDRAFT_03963 [Frankia sp. CeD]ORT92221.1 hypothetical protein UK99_22505 [Frankia casuarinae]ORT92457.1 hypothetical protein UK99_21980 [Frankia casuarinae]
MDERRFVAWDADGRPLGAFPDFDTAHEWAHVRMRQARTRLPLTLDDRVAKVSRRLSHARCELVAWAEFAVLPGCDLPALGAAAAAAAGDTARRQPAQHSRS